MGLDVSLVFSLPGRLTASQRIFKNLYIYTTNIEPYINLATIVNASANAQNSLSAR